MHPTIPNRTADLLRNSPPRRIALFLFDLSLTGVARNGVRLANALAEVGHIVNMLVCRADAGHLHRLNRKVAVVEVGSHAQRKLSRTLAMALAIPALRRRIASLSPDVLVSLGNHGHLAAFAASLGLRTNRVYRVSNDLHHPDEGIIAHLARRGVMAMMIRGAARVMLVSAHLASDPVFAASRKAGKLQVVTNGVAAATIRKLGEPPCGHPWLDDKDLPCIVSVGRLSAQKNHATLLEALAIANRETPVRLLLLGQGTATARSALLARIAGLGLADRVALLDPVENPFPFLARASTFVLPSLWEGASNVLLEAVALDVPIVAARSAGNAQDVLAYGRFGLLVDPLDADALARSILLQMGPDAIHPGARALDFDLTRATSRACSLILDAAAGETGRLPIEHTSSALAKVLAK